MADPPIMPSNGLGLSGRMFCVALASTAAALDIRTGSARRWSMVRLVWALLCPRPDWKAARVTIWGADAVWVGEVVLVADILEKDDGGVTVTIAGVE